MAPKTRAETDSRRQIGLRIRELRRLNKLTQDDLAGVTGRSVDTISALERGLALPSFESLEKLAVAFGVPIGDLFGHDVAGGSEKQTRLLATLISQARTLSEAELAVAVDQIQAIIRHR
jgi:transcriptional regulator with XRE-family HTH domain